MLGGNPDFTQTDPRKDPQFGGMVNLVASSSLGGAFMWGDSGEACFLPPRGFAESRPVTRGLCLGLLLTAAHTGTAKSTCVRIKIWLTKIEKSFTFNML